MTLLVEEEDIRSLLLIESMRMLPSNVRAWSWARDQIEYEQAVRIRSSVKHQSDFSENVQSKSETRGRSGRSNENRANAGRAIALSSFIAKVSGESRLGDHVND